MPVKHDLDVSTLSGMIRTACLLECTARKPGNVHPEASFEDLAFEHFVRSAEVVAPILARSSSIGVTQAILRAVEATRREVGTNSNLGLILLIAPLAAVPQSRLSLCESTSFRGAKDDDGCSLEVELTSERVGEVLDALTTDDTKRLYEAIRLARPGGMGTSPKQDVADVPTVTVVQAMTLAADRDFIARQYRDHFKDVLETGVNELLRWMGQLEIRNPKHETPSKSPIRNLNSAADVGHSCCGFVSEFGCRASHFLPSVSPSLLPSFPPWERAVIGLQLSLMARFGDSLIARKCGEAISQAASQRAQRVLELDWPFSDAAWKELARFDGWLREDGHSRNPGTTADLIGAILFAAIRNRPWHPPGRDEG